MSALLASLRRDNHRNGRLVRSTSGVWRWWDTRTDQSKSNSSRPRTKELSFCTEWYLDVLRACSRLERVDVFFSTENLCDLSLRALLNSFGSLNEIHFHPDPEAVEGTVLDLPTAFKIMRVRLPRTLAEATFNSLDWAQGSSLHSLELPVAVSKLSVLLYPGSTLNVSSFLPSPFAIPPLQSLQFDLQDDSQAAVTTLREIAQRIGASLRKLDLAFPTRSGPRSLDEYKAVTPNLHLPLDPAFPFPQLHHLVLYGCRSLSLRFLESLLSNSPLLEGIGFYESSWTPDPGSSNLVEDELFEAKLIERLRKFGRLKNVDLGDLPTVTRRAYPTLRATFTALGVEVSFQTCTQRERSVEI
ncbi:hypothetical protein JCM11491_001139 [Sporobolomyces phaffii]